MGKLSPRVAPIVGLLAIGLSACSSSSTQSGTPNGTGGAAGTGTNVITGTGGAPSGSAGQMGTDGGPAAGGSAGTTSGGATGGASGSVDAGGSGGVNGGADASGPTAFVCNQVTAMTLTREWYEAGFETFVTASRWQLKAREHGYITEWSNPNSDFWNEPIESPCAQGSTQPDHVVLTVLSWVPPCCATQAQWQTQITGAINTLRAKYPGLRRIDLMTVIRGPGNHLCPTAPAAGETIVIPPELDGALAAAATQFPGLVFVAPRFEAPSCAAFSGGGPHLTSAGNAAVASMIGAYFATIQ
ncbi:MAG TPA: hypothetical protein VFH68_14930 [Polyangia bacterium]|jgi:hypothetical protein|nr:hypothetical protein [Polyangia bacterium]